MIIVKRMLAAIGVLLLVVMARPQVGGICRTQSGNLSISLRMITVKMLWYAPSVVVVQVTGNETF